MSLINWGRGSAVDLPEGEMSFQLMEGSGFPLAWHIRETLEPSFTTRSLERLMIFGGTGETEIKGKFNEGINPYWSSEQCFWWHLDIIWLDWSTRCVCKSQIPRSPENSTFRPSCFLLKLALRCTFHMLLKGTETKRPSVGLRGWNWTPGWGVGRGHAHHCDIIKGYFQRI